MLFNRLSGFSLLSFSFEGANVLSKPIFQSTNRSTEKNAELRRLSAGTLIEAEGKEIVDHRMSHSVANACLIESVDRLLFVGDRSTEDFAE